ncbi:MAG: outer membrane beta-barrel protein [Candidatus Aminicenantaceae bacterium]
MRRLSNGKVIFCLVVVLFAVLPLSGQTEKQKIKVVVENATIRANPDLQSDVIKHTTLGAVFEVEEKEGEWFTIKVQTEVGVLLTGYIHEMFVEVEEEEKEDIEEAVEMAPEPEEKVVEVQKKLESPMPPQEARPTRMEIAFGGSYTSGYSINSVSYSDSFSEGSLERANENGTITQGLEKPMGFYGSFNFFLTQGLGIELRLDINSSANYTSSSMSNYRLSWEWSDGRSSDTTKQWDIQGGGVSSLTVFSGNLMYKVRTGGFFAPFFSGGVSYYSGSLNKASTFVGYGTTWAIEDFQFITRYIDFFDIPATLEASFSGIGFNVGGGADLQFSRSLALNIDARYFMLKNVEERWQVRAGTYPTNLHEGVTITLLEQNALALQESITPVEIKTSFFKISLGLKLMF